MGLKPGDELPEKCYQGDFCPAHFDRRCLVLIILDGVVFYERGVSKKNISHAGGMKDSFERQPPPSFTATHVKTPSPMRQLWVHEGAASEPN